MVVWGFTSLDRDDLLIQAYCCHVTISDGKINPAKIHDFAVKCNTPKQTKG